MSRYRTQGSLIGSYRTPSSTSASGVYDITGATTYTSANLWAGTTPVSTVVIVQNPLAGNLSIASGGTSTIVGNYQIITFTGSGSFTPSQTGNVELMLIGGGGGGASTSSDVVSPGSSSGGMIYYGSQLYPYRAGTSITLASGVTYTVTIGGGGATAATNGSAGGNSSVVGGSINLTAYGGARSPAASEFSGGCGGGYWGTASHLTGNAAPNQGYPGSSATGGAATAYYAEVGGAGLGGMAPGIAVQNYSPGGYSNDYSRGAGGIGFYTDISGSLAYYGAGGNGGIKYFASVNGISANSQPGGGGTAPGYDGVTIFPAVSALPNTGSGGAGGARSTSSVSLWYSGSAGGSGILIMRIPLYSVYFGNIANISVTGGTVTTNGDYKTATFTGSGSFTVLSAQTNAVVEYLCVAGGGGGAAVSLGGLGNKGGGAGAGGFLEYYNGAIVGSDYIGPVIFINAGNTFTVTVGSGGAGGYFATMLWDGAQGGNSSIVSSSCSVVAIGGGYGGKEQYSNIISGGLGGSGGGGGHRASNNSNYNGSRGNESSAVYPKQGTNGADSGVGYSTDNSAGNGGGAARASFINGSIYASGGAGGSGTTASNGAPGTSNTGNGGGGAQGVNSAINRAGGNGGSGIVVIRWKFQ